MALKSPQYLSEYIFLTTTANRLLIPRQWKLPAMPHAHLTRIHITIFALADSQRNIPHRNYAAYPPPIQPRVLYFNPEFGHAKTAGALIQ